MHPSFQHRIVLAALAGALLVPAASDASTVRREGATVLFAAGSQETNTVRLSERAGELIVSDTTITRARLQAGPGCRLLETNIAACGFNVGAVDVRTHDRDDIVFGDSRIPAIVDGGSGDETFHAGRAPEASRTRWVGGPGFDTVDFANATAGVTVTKDGRPGDGRAGDADDVGLDVERVAGSRFADSLHGSDAPLEVWVGNAGDDVMVGFAGSDRFLERDAGNGADLINGGGGDGNAHEDVLDYGNLSDRATGVAVALNGRPDDGAAGEGDNVLGVETYHLTRFADRFTGTSVREAVFALGGNDFLDGLGGDDLIDCEAGLDTAIVHPGDRRLACESVGRLRLRARVEGRDVRLAVAWTHPVAQRELRRIVVRVGRAGRDVLVAGRGPGRTFRGVAHVRVPRGVRGPLPVTVVAIDRQGNRQTERRAGLVRLP